MTLLEQGYTLDEIDLAACRFWEVASGYRTIAFSGEMAAGKTTFIHHLCDHLQVQDTVSSPTFALINEYHFAGPGGEDMVIHHMDWYRLKDAADAINAGMEDCINAARKGNTWCFVEWPEKARELLSAPYLWVAIESVTRVQRKMTVTLINEG